eukprot:gene3656-9935_t
MTTGRIAALPAAGVTRLGQGMGSRQRSLLGHRPPPAAVADHSDRGRAH